MKNISMIIIIGILTAAASSSANMVRVSVTGTARSGTHPLLSLPEYDGPYVIGESYTFEWIITDEYAGGLNDTFMSSLNDWYSYAPDNDPSLIESVSGDGLVGTYLRADDCDEDLYISSDGMLVQAYSGTPIGLTCNGFDVKAAWASGLVVPGMDYSDTSFVDPAVWLSSYVGTYALSSGGITILTTDTPAAYFDVTSVTISAVPEPATVGLMGICGAVGFLIRRLRKYYA